jgi:hypothetical protein
MNFSIQTLLVFYVANQVLSALIQSLPSPTTASNGLYVFIFKFLSLLIADFKSFTAQLPPPPLLTSGSSSTTIVSTVGPVSSSQQATVEAIQNAIQAQPVSAAK